MKKIVTVLAATAILSGGTVVAQEYKNQIKARQGTMWVIALNLGTLGAMATPELNRWIAHLQERHAAVRARRLEFERAASQSPAPSETGSEGSWEKIETYKKGTTNLSKSAGVDESKED